MLLGRKRCSGVKLRHHELSLTHICLACFYLFIYFIISFYLFIPSLEVSLLLQTQFKLPGHKQPPAELHDPLKELFHHLNQPCWSGETRRTCRNTAWCQNSVFTLIFGENMHVVQTLKTHILLQNVCKKCLKINLFTKQKERN